MHEQVDEAHLRSPGNPFGAIDANAYVRQTGFDKGGRVVIPKLGKYRQRLQERPGNIAKISESDVTTGQDMVRHAVCFIEGAEHGRLQSFTTLREHRSASLRISRRFQQGEYVLGTVLSVGIHENHAIRLPALLQMR